MVDLRQTSEYAKYMKSIGWIAERKSRVNYFIKKFPLIGSFMKIQRPEKIDFNIISELVHEYKTFQVVIEPKSISHKLSVICHKFHQSKTPFVPAKTIHIDLTKSEKHLLSEMHYKTRYNIKLGKRLKLKVKISKDINLFADFWQECALKQRGNFISQKKEIINLYKAFMNKTDLVFAIRSNELLAGILLIHTEKTSYYMYAAASDAGKKLFAPTLVAWKAIKKSKEKGSKIFDFEGIYDERFPLKSWRGFTRFKKSFGGREITYPGVFTKYRFPI